MWKMWDLEEVVVLLENREGRRKKQAHIAQVQNTYTLSTDNLLILSVFQGNQKKMNYLHCLAQTGLVPWQVQWQRTEQYQNTQLM